MRAAASAADALAETIRRIAPPAWPIATNLANLGASVNRALTSVARASIADSAIFPARIRARRSLHATSDQLSLRERSDEELIVAHRSGDTAALRVLVERYSSELHGFLTRLVGTRAGADDVFQEAFLQVHLSADAFDSERRFKPWLYTIAANKGREAAAAAPLGGGKASRKRPRVEEAKEGAVGGGAEAEGAGGEAEEAAGVEVGMGWVAAAGGASSSSIPSSSSSSRSAARCSCSTYRRASPRAWRPRCRPRAPGGAPRAA
jgi:RNA polymerase sigma factor (sigma-70 family)